MKITLKILLLSVFFLSLNPLLSQQKFLVRGSVFESDTNLAIPFAYVININTQNGVITDIQGRFSVIAGENDSLQFACIGYEKKIVKVNSIANENDSVKAFKKVHLKRKVYELGSVYVNTFKIKPNERDYMQRVINRPKVQGVNVVESPITAIWQAFSKKGKEMQKLEAIFTDLLRKEQIEQKVNTGILRKLLDDENITLEQFRILCPEITDDFILSNDGYELYSQISAAYKARNKRRK